MERHPSVSDPEIAGTRCFPGRRTEVGGDVSGDTVHGPGRNVLGDHVHEAANRIGAVEQSGGTSYHFDALRGGGIHADTVVAGLARKIPQALPVLENLDTVAVEPANDRPGR